MLSKSNMVWRFVGTLALLSLLAVRPAAAADGLWIQVVSDVDVSAYPKHSVVVSVRDANGSGSKNLKPEHFRLVVEQEFISPSQVQPVTTTISMVSVALVVDMGIRDGEVAARMRADAERLLSHLFAAQPAGGEQVLAEVALYVLRGDAVQSGYSPLVLPFTADQQSAMGAVASIQQQSGKTNLYDTIDTAIKEASEARDRRRAAGPGGPAYVFVLGNGSDGGSSTDLSRVKEQAVQRGVAVFALGYPAAGTELQNLGVLADYTGGTWAPQPGEQTTLDMVRAMREQASGGAYQLTFVPSLPADDERHTLKIQVGAEAESGEVETDYLLLRPQQARDAPVVKHVEASLDASAYPSVTLAVRPIGELRRTVRGLDASQFELTLDSTPLPVADVRLEPLDPLDPAAVPSLGLVVDLQGEAGTVQSARDGAYTLLTDSSGTCIDARVGLFVVPDSAAPASPASSATAGQEFTNDVCGIANAIGQIAIPQPDTSGGSVGATLLRALDVVGENADANRRPGYVVLFSENALTPDIRQDALVKARKLHVPISIVVPPGQQADESMQHLARDTGGIYFSGDQATQELHTYTQTTLTERTSYYRLSLNVPLFPDQQEHKLVLRLAGTQQDISLTPSVAGTASVRTLITPVLQVLIFVLVAGAVAGYAWLPGRWRDRQRCPTCGRMQRASWGGRCPFCEGEARASGDSELGAPNPLLEGFHKRGLALVYGSVADPLPAPGPSYDPGPRQPPASLSDTSEFWGKLPEPPASSPVPAGEARVEAEPPSRRKPSRSGAGSSSDSPGRDAPPAGGASEPPKVGTTPLGVERRPEPVTYSDTDFWGASRDDSADDADGEAHKGRKPPAS